MTDKSIETEEEFDKQLNEMLKSMVKERLEKIMEAERNAFLFEEEPEDVANGYYNRNWETRFGEIEDLEVSRDREGEFSTKLFSPYQRRSGWLENLVIKMYSRELSTRKIADLLEEMYGTHYSSTTVSRITDQTLEDVKEWRNRPLAKSAFSSFKDKWNDTYPDVVESWEDDLQDLLTFMDYT